MIKFNIGDKVEVLREDLTRYGEPTQRFGKITEVAEDSYTVILKTGTEEIYYMPLVFDKDRVIPA